MQAAESFVAPRAPAAGTPSPEAMARLQHAVARQPQAAQRPAAPAPQTQPEQQRARFGINSLINRMTGQNAEAEQRAQPQVRAIRNEDPELDPEQERIEIPAFLRRQAN